MTKEIVLKSKITNDEYTDYAKKMYDIPPSDESVVKLKKIDLESIDEESNILLIIGPSGSGKSSIMREQFKSFEDCDDVEFSKDSLISNFKHLTPEKAGEALSMCGLSSIPAWLRPFSVLSEGQKARAKAAYFLSKFDKVKIDEFTSTVNREVAKSLSYSIQKYVKRNNKKLVVCSCHYDIIDWLNPDYVYDVEKEELEDRRSLRQISRPSIELRVEKCEYKWWSLFHKHHYLSASLNKAAKRYLVTWNNVPVAFTSFLPQPHARLINTWRESRTVVLPDFQGLGIGSKISELIAGSLKNEGHSYISKTTHPSFVNYRNKSKKWKMYYKGKSSETGKTGKIKMTQNMIERYCYSHIYVGERYLDSNFLEVKEPVIENIKFDNQFIESILNREKTTTIRNYSKRKGVLLNCLDESDNIFCVVKVIDVKKTKERTQYLKDRYNEDDLYEHNFEIYKKIGV